MNYKNREQYKHLMRVLAVAANCASGNALFFSCVLGTDTCEPPVAGAVSGIREIRLSS